ncbi:MAG: glutathione S-transferase [Thiomicrorhabdus chilensis]|uniref:glutathione S-transferase n=1 Tax=Thiomicrorhabdus chilensis TaxID=63656 RepID=UPI00299E6AA6|nr:glutathione S-transferase [Thiomicrorhabdus chilensis]MDX1347142.1 glutathione S-transferase [Thiomicrorhabdus chilensis]
MDKHPVLYSYRRCPYAMRSRMAIYLAGLQVEQREIVFWDKPEPMLQASPKATVPVLVLEDGCVIEESREIMEWALHKVDVPWVSQQAETLERMNAWIDENDGDFKHWLDRYKYADRFPEQSKVYYRQRGERFLAKLEEALQNQSYLIGEQMSMADLAVFPFIRQFANVDKVWFAESGYEAVRAWLHKLLGEDFFAAVMKNRPVWQAIHVALWVNEPDLQTRDQFLAKAESR